MNTLKYIGAFPILAHPPHTKRDTDTILTCVVVTDASPLMPTLPALVEGLNTHRDLFAFLRQVRQAFITSLDA
jgi:hypothetical protein